LADILQKGPEPRNITLEFPAAADSLPTLFSVDAPLEIVSLRAVLTGDTSPSVTWELKFATNRDEGSPTDVITGGGTVTTNVSGGEFITSIDNASIPADVYYWLEIVAASGNVLTFNLTIAFA
jgi:hypothetical protein